MKKIAATKPPAWAKQIVTEYLDEESGVARRRRVAFKSISEFSRSLPHGDKQVLQDQATSIAKARDSIVASHRQLSNNVIKKIRAFAVELDRPFERVYLDLIQSCYSGPGNDDFPGSLLPEFEKIWKWLAPILQEKPRRRLLEILLENQIDNEGMMRQKEYSLLFSRFMRRLSDDIRMMVQELRTSGLVKIWSLKYLARSVALPDTAFKLLTSDLRESLQGELTGLARSALDKAQLIPDNKKDKRKPAHVIVYERFRKYKRRYPKLSDKDTFEKIASDLGKTVSAVRGAYYHHLQWLRLRKHGGVK